MKSVINIPEHDVYTKIVSFTEILTLKQLRSNFHYSKLLWVVDASVSMKPDSGLGRQTYHGILTGLWQTDRSYTFIRNILTLREEIGKRLWRDIYSDSSWKGSILMSKMFSVKHPLICLCAPLGLCIDRCIVTWSNYCVNISEELSLILTGSHHFVLMFFSQAITVKTKCFTRLRVLCWRRKPS